MFSIYVHIPFCLKKCDYCDFYSIAASDEGVPEQSYLKACIDQLQREVKEKGLNGRTISSVYFGGGTPSIFSSSFFERFLEEIYKNFTVEDDVEISCEVNPATADAKWFAEMKDVGVTRISLGVQSFNSNLLQSLGRIHSADDAMRAIAEAQDADFKSVSLDLIYAIPGEAVSELEDDIRTAMTFQPEHISAYQLTPEEGTLLKKRVDESEIELLSDSEILKQMAIVSRMLDRVGWRKYEISNYAKPGFECRHNVNYWRYGEYLGVGSGATSFIRSGENTFGRRYTQARDVMRYIDGSLELDDDECIDEKTAMSEFMFMGLRTLDGIDTQRFSKVFNRDLADIYGRVVKELIDDRLIHEMDGGGNLRLTPKGVEISNYVFTKFM
ncbi:MAG: radical SAM family heme chaperone HemW [Deltaproteobacteria bacterium]|jgi:oxygen-independent coproporphyrinogen III oxidase|nr:radical SAM family heme chaperone HemW [Deltaproteobacteria bacterium]